MGDPIDLCSVPNGCDDGGLCMYPPQGVVCEAMCSDDLLTTKTCDGAGGCSAPTKMPCPGHASCAGNSCSGPCNADGGCASGYYCSGIADGQGSCVQMLPGGAPCDAGNECYSGVCDGDNGLCCSHAGSHDSTPECAPFGCSDAGACLYPQDGTSCDVANESCIGSTLHAGACDGMGNCIDAGVPCPFGFHCDTEGSKCVQIADGG